MEQMRSEQLKVNRRKAYIDICEARYEEFGPL